MTIRDTRRHVDRLVGDSAARRLRIFLSVSETWKSATVARNAACTSCEPKIDSHVDFDLTAAWRHHVSMLPSSRSQSAATTALAGGTCELFRVKQLREIPDWWILGRCLPPNGRGGRTARRHHTGILRRGVWCASRRERKKDNPN